jgi:hypothetical protein
MGICQLKIRMKSYSSYRLLLLFATNIDTVTTKMIYYKCRSGARTQIYNFSIGSRSGYINYTVKLEVIILEQNLLNPLFYSTYL